MSPGQWTIAVLPGDGIGPEVTRAATTILQDCAREFGFRVNLVEYPFGGIAIDTCGKPLPQETLDGCLKADAVLLGAVGGPKWDSQPLDRRPEAGLLDCGGRLAFTPTCARSRSASRCGRSARCG